MTVIEPQLHAVYADRIPDRFSVKDKPITVQNLSESVEPMGSVLYFPSLSAMFGFLVLMAFIAFVLLNIGVALIWLIIAPIPTLLIIGFLLR